MVVVVGILALLLDVSKDTTGPIFSFSIVGLVDAKDSAGVGEIKPPSFNSSKFLTPFFLLDYHITY